MNRVVFSSKSMFYKPASFRVALAWAILAISCSSTSGQSSSQTTETEVWPEVDAHVQFASNLRVLAFTGLEPAVGYRREHSGRYEAEDN